MGPALPGLVTSGPGGSGPGLSRVDVERAEYWDAPSGTMAEVAGLSKTTTTGGTSVGGENEKIDLTGAEV